MGLQQQSFEAKIDRSGEHHLWLGAKSARGVGQVRVQRKLHSAPRFAWELANGPVPEGSRVMACPDEPSCVRLDHVRLDPPVDARSSTVAAGRSRHGGGSIKALGPNTWKLTIDAGRDEDGHRRRVYRTVHGTKSEASRTLASLVMETADLPPTASRSSSALTVNDLIEWYLNFARDERGLEHSTLVGYREAYESHVRPHIGHLRARAIDVAELDKLFGRMRRAGLSRSRMNNVRALLSGAFKWGKRHRKVNANPVDRFELPASSQVPKEPTTPEVEDLLRLLDGADLHDPELAPVLKLGATTGMRRGELAGLRRDRLRLDRAELLVDTAVNDAGGIVVVKPTKTKRNRVVSLDPSTIELLRAHLANMDARARECGAAIDDDAYVFSLDPACRTPMRPELMTRRMRQLRKRIGIGPGEFDATILALRRWTTTELMDAGFNPSAVSGRQGHTVQILLHHYSTRRRSADRAAANHLGRRVYGRESDQE